MFLTAKNALVILINSTLLAAATKALGVTLNFIPVAELSGIATVADGDGLLFGNVEVRLQGIAAPELDTEIGRASAENLRRIAQGKFVICYLDGTRAGKSLRPVAVCTLDGTDLGETQVFEGHARDCPRFSKGRYAVAEREAVARGSDLSAKYKLPRYCN